MTVGAAAAPEPPAGQTASVLSASPSIGARPAAFKTTAQEVTCVFLLTFAAASSSISQGITQVTTSVVGRDLHMLAAGITFINAGQTLTTSSFLLFFGSLADIVGRKKLLICALAFFSAFLAISGAAKNTIWFDTLRGLQGLAIAAAIPASAGILGATYGEGVRDFPHLPSACFSSSKRRCQSIRKNRAFAVFSAGNPLGFTFGSISAGIAAHIFDWRAGLYFWAIIFGAFTVLAYLVVPADAARDKSRRLDPVGALLIVAGLCGVISSLSLAGGAPDGWRTPYILVLLCLGIGLVAAFVFWQTSRFNRQPMMPLSIFKSRDYSLLVVLISTGFAGFSSSLFFISLYMQTVKSYSTLSTALHFLPATISGVIVNWLAALLLHRVNNRLLLLAGTIGYTAGNLLFSFAAFPDTSYWAFIFTGQILLVYGADFQFCVANMYILSHSSKENQSLASGVFNTTCQIGISLGLALTSAVFQAINGADVVEFTSVTISPARYRAYRAVFYFAVGFSALGFVLLPFIRIGKQGATKRASAEEIVPKEDIALDDIK